MVHLKVSKKLNWCAFVLMIVLFQMPIGGVAATNAFYPARGNGFKKGITKTKESYVQNQVIVKFKPAVVDQVSSIKEGERFADYLPRAASLDALNEKHGAHNFRRVFKSYEVKNTKGEITNVLDSRNRVMQLRKRKAKLRKVLPEHIKNLPQLENIFVVDLKPGEDVLSVAEAYQKDPNVVYAEPNYYFKEFLIPNDLEYDYQWALPKIKADLAWGQFASEEAIGKGVICAILDTGVSYDIPELAENIWLNAGELMAADEDGNGEISLAELGDYGVADSNLNGIIDPQDIYSSSLQDGIDNDNNGYVDDFVGWNFGAEPSDNVPNDDQWMHGSHVAGTVAAVTNNHLGVAGLSWNSKIMALKIINNQGGLQADDAAAAVIYAVENGADVMNMSWGLLTEEGWPLYSQLVSDAFRYATSAGVVLVAAAGNDGMEVAAFPAIDPDVIAVSATDNQDQPADFTNYGDWVDVAAPGVDILSVAGLMSGTSMASPHVVGLAALILSQKGDLGEGALRVERVRRMILGSTDPLSSPLKVGTGRINANAALQLSPDEPLLSRIIYPWSTMTMSSNTVLGGIVAIRGIAAGAQFSSYSLFVKSELGGDGVLIVAPQYAPNMGGELGVWDTRGFADGFYELELEVQDTQGATAIHKIYVHVDNAASLICGDGIVKLMRIILGVRLIVLQSYAEMAHVLLSEEKTP